MDKNKESEALQKQEHLTIENIAFEAGKDSFKKTPEHREQEKIAEKGLKREIELMELDEGLKEEAEKKAKKIQFLAEDEKLENLLEIAKNKGVISAIETAKAMNDPYLLDTLHDILAKEGYYKKFEK